MSTTTTFDALTAARDLKAAGFEPDQAEALAAQLRTAAGADHDELAKKADLAELRADIHRALWILGAGVVAIIGGFIAIAASLKLL